MDNEKKISLTSGEHLDSTTILGLRNTKAIQLNCIACSFNRLTEIKKMKRGEIEYTEPEILGAQPIGTWSNVINESLDFLQSYINVCVHLCGGNTFISKYETCLKDILDECDVKSNSNFVRRLFKKEEEETLISSRLYLNSRNHRIEIFTDIDTGEIWYACAVFTGEIIWVLEALIDTIDCIYREYLSPEEYKNKPIPEIGVVYIDRYSDFDTASEEIENKINDTLDNEDKSVDSALANDLVTLFLNTSILQLKAPSDMKEDLDLMKSKYIEIAKKHNIDLVNIMKDMIS